MIGYEAELDHVKCGRKLKSVTGNDKHVIFDTGSSGTYLVTKIYEEILYVVSFTNHTLLCEVTK